MTLGAGTPLTVHVKTNASWSTAVILSGSSSIVGATGRGGERGGGERGGRGERGEGERGGRGEGGEGVLISTGESSAVYTCYSSHAAIADTHQLVQL